MFRHVPSQFPIGKVCSATSGSIPVGRVCSAASLIIFDWQNVFHHVLFDFWSAECVPPHQGQILVVRVCSATSRVEFWSAECVPPRHAGCGSVTVTPLLQYAPCKRYLVVLLYIGRLFVRNLTDGGGFKGIMKAYEGL